MTCSAHACVKLKQKNYTKNAKKDSLTERDIKLTFTIAVMQSYPIISF